MKVYPTYVSKACAKSLWNEYRVYEDRVELKFWIESTPFTLTQKLTKTPKHDVRKFLQRW